ncbi:hypothetical protein GY45DRAFT_850264 [Cubamyces sp. BRFM 1775]|nr:hypothetical protein GY45DRAFT_850264 [Cubamyces sp. BRFM 1775]
MLRQPEALFTEKILHIELVYEPIFDSCSAATLLRVARTCRAAHRAIKAYSRVAFDVNRLLSRFFPSKNASCSSICTMDHEHEQAYDRARAFRSLQARTGTVISGSCALQFFDRSIYPESDLDLYVHMCHRQEVGRWLIQEGYVYEPTSHQDKNFEFEVAEEHDTFWDEYFGEISSIFKVFNFKKRVTKLELPLDDVKHYSVAGLQSSEGRGELRVQLIVPKETPMEVILGFHSTCVMNVISYHKAYCLFPQATLEERLALFTSSPSEDSLSRNTDQYRCAISKYTERGFTFIRGSRISSAERGAGTTHKDLQDDLACRTGALSLTNHSVRAPRLPSATSSVQASSATMAASRSAPAPKHSRKSRKSARRSKPTFRFGERWIDDSDSWVLPLPLTGVVLPNTARTSTTSLVRDPVAICNWEMRREYVNDRVVMHFEVIEGNTLQYKYLVHDPKLLEDLRAEFTSMRGPWVDLSANGVYFDEELWGLCKEFLKYAE